MDADLLDDYSRYGCWDWYVDKAEMTSLWLASYLSVGILLVALGMQATCAGEAFPAPGMQVPYKNDALSILLAITAFLVIFIGGLTLLGVILAVCPYCANAW